MAISKVDMPDTGNQSGFFNKYPYTDFHEMNLDFLLSSYASIITQINQVIDWANAHEIDYEEAIARLEAVENEIDTFEAQVNASFDRLSQDIQNQLEAMKVEVDAEVAEMKEEVNAAINQFYIQFETLKNQINDEMNRLKAEVRQSIAEFYNIMEANNEYVFQYVENRLNEFINSFPEILTVYVYNPARGKVTDIQTAVYDLYDIACIWGLTASQFDSLQLTATEFDALDLTCQQFDQLGYKLLYKDPANYMYNPFNGLYEPLQDVIMDLAHLHMGGLTATDFDAKELTASEFDALDLTAFQFDWFGDELIA